MCDGANAARWTSTRASTSAGPASPDPVPRRQDRIGRRPADLMPLRQREGGRREAMRSRRARSAVGPSVAKRLRGSGPPRGRMAARPVARRRSVQIASSSWSARTRPSALPCGQYQARPPAPPSASQSRMRSPVRVGRLVGRQPLERHDRERDVGPAASHASYQPGDPGQVGRAPVVARDVSPAAVPMRHVAASITARRRGRQGPASVAPRLATGSRSGRGPAWRRSPNGATNMISSPDGRRHPPR